MTAAPAGFARRVAAWWRPDESARRWGWFAAYAAASAVAWRLLTANFQLTSFHGRSMSWATLEGVDIGARTGVYSQCLVLGVAVFVLALLALRALERAFAPWTSTLVNGLGVGGIALLCGRAFGLDVWTQYNLVASLVLAVFGLGFAEQRFFRAAPLREPAALLAAGALAALWVPFVVDDLDTGRGSTGTRWMDWAVGAFALVSCLVARAIAGARGPERRQRVLDHVAVFLACGALAPIASACATELYMTLNNAGQPSWTPVHAEYAVLALTAVLAAVVAWRVPRRAGFALEPWIARRAFPVLVFALFTFLYYRPAIEFTEDLFEPANSGLMIQQLIDFGRLPFIDTFSAHGFSDSAMGFVWRLVHGTRDETWVHWYGVVDGALLLLTYALLLRVTRSPWLALFTAILFPFHEPLFPVYARAGLSAVFVVTWTLDRPRAKRWAALTFFLAALFLWRLDNGFAALVACVATIAAAWVVDPAARPRFGAFARGTGVALAACVLLWCVLCLARGVNPILRLVDLAHVTASGQAFGAPTVAPVIDALQSFHLFVMPALVLALTLWFVVRWRGALSGAASRTQATRGALLALVFCAAYYFANFPRGLVRHTFLETGNVYLQSFSCAVVALAWYVLWERGAVARAAAFLGTATLLGSSFHLYAPIRDRGTPFQPAYQQVERFMQDYPRVPYTDTPFDRSPMWPRLKAQFYDAWIAFTQRHLAPQQTFLDLGNNPMLYVLTHRVSPHYLNHLFIASDEWLNRRAIAEFAQHDVPFVLARTEQDLALRDQAPALVDMDSVDAWTRNYRFYEWLYPRYEPWCIVQRWQVWKRVDWASTSEPTGTDARTRLTLAAKAARDGVITWIAEPGAALALDAQRPAHLGITGVAAKRGSVTLRLRLARSGRDETFERRVTLEAGTQQRWFALPGELHGADVTALELDLRAAPGFEFGGVELRDLVAPDQTECWLRAANPVAADLHQIPWLWGSRDEGQPLAQPVLRDVLTTPLDVPQARRAIAIEQRTNESFQNGIARGRPGFVLAFDDAADLPRVGDVVEFAASGPRTVVELNVRRVFVSGPALDPVRDGAPNAVRVTARDTRRASVDSGSWRRIPFEPVPDPRAPCSLVLRIDRATAGKSSAYLRWGERGRVLGSIALDLAGTGEQDYLVRASAFPTWARARADWIEIAALGAPVRVVSARLLAGD